ncbi:hypothetical protein CHGG_04945 [Chaetomium globosum CBS 148.51]|uniref:Adenylate kinase n=1 Tax=Chaetomium globosum (strain ATCC 6205 / CBS 148.51 / DSM 1962 / NBRC 6347 / NRRL 1970) TaxID=306901 RepID=Q2GZV1_CHAGB|nr:uncharacterized protein CHGG_04945 [Chaetomium globosum CBS 148.51]EAQ88326.1 hypothetical protein CHGG_04945 [Chaetomium globosum CBS 148.51]
MDDKYECGNRSFIFVISSPGAGKGTLSRWLAEDNDFTHISIGDMLREFGKGSGQMHKIIKGSFADPALVILFDCSVAVAKERVGGGIDPEDFDTRYYKYVNDNQRILLEYIAVFPEHRGKLVEINADGDAATTYWILREALRSKPEWSALLDSSVSPPPSPSS